MTAVDFCAGTDEASALEAGHMVTMPPKAEHVLIAKKRILKTVGRIYVFDSTCPAFSNSHSVAFNLCTGLTGVHTSGLIPLPMIFVTQPKACFMLEAMLCLVCILDRWSLNSHTSSWWIGNF